MATPESAKQAYQDICKNLKEAQKLKNQLDAILNECEKLARRNDLVFEKRYLDELPEILDPDTYEIKEVRERTWDGKTVKEYRKIFKDELPKELISKGAEPGEDVEYSWIPSSLC